MLIYVYHGMFFITENETFLAVATSLSILHVSLDGSSTGTITQGAGLARYLGVDYDYQ